MKANYLKIASVLSLLIIVMSVFSCSSEDTEGGDDNPVLGPFVAKVENQSFGTQGYQARYLSTTKMLQIIGNTENNEETIVITIMRIGDETISSFSDWTPQTFELVSPISWGEGSYITSIQYNKYNYDIDGYEIWQNDPEAETQIGQVEITEISENHIKGTFFVDTYKYDGTYNHSDSKHITEGAFDLDLTIN